MADAADYPEDIKPLVTRAPRMATAALLDLYEPSPAVWGEPSYRSPAVRIAAYLDRAERGELPPLPTLSAYGDATLAQVDRLRKARKGSDDPAPPSAA